VGAEYILEERAYGQSLWSLWQDWIGTGCIYFKEDVPYGDHLVITSTALPSTLERFRMGPLVTMDHWQKEKASMDLNKGPCK
jgi:hypothetical protein